MLDTIQNSNGTLSYFYLCPVVSIGVHYKNINKIHTILYIRHLDTHIRWSHEVKYFLTHYNMHVFFIPHMRLFQNWCLGCLGGTRQRKHWTPLDTPCYPMHILRCPAI